jgi:ATP phosphoribosyltransferase
MCVSAPKEDGDSYKNIVNLRVATKYSNIAKA